MPTETTAELELFHEFLGNQLRRGFVGLSVDDSVRAFRDYQRELEQFRQDIQTALAESAEGQSQPLDVDDIVARGRQRAAANGIVDECHT
jgi:hypothetical protein